VNSTFAAATINALLTSVTLCVPGTTTCQTIPNILVDTGSSGVRILASQLSLALPPVTSESDLLGECFEFVNAAVWGPVVTADVGLAEEKALAVPIQLIASPSFAAPPVACTSSGLPLRDTPQTLHANGILGGCPRINVYGLLIVSSNTVQDYSVRVPLKSCPFW
jgi:hypothetical protein